MIKLGRINTIIPAMAALVLGFTSAASAQDNGSFAADPALTQPVELAPKVMLSMSLDHQLFIKAYNDYDDLDGDNVADVTYNNNYRYVGYFDNQKCYNYADEMFTVRGAAADDASCPDAGDVDGGWSGNFLNWATMTRIDLVRHVLYGGLRSTDTANTTVLERSYLPHDSHSFAKYFSDEAEIEDLVGPLSGELVSGCTSTDPQQCVGFTFCNTSKPVRMTGTNRSQDVDTEVSPPLLRVIKGNYSLWAAGERYQCLAENEFVDGATNPGQSGNEPSITEINAFPRSPSNTDGIDDFVVRVKVCETNDGAHSCKQYSGDTYKPVGLLHEYGEAGTVEFGLLTGSYTQNKDGGALRSRVRNFADEIANDGTFSYPSGTPERSLIGNLDAFRIIDYVFGHGTSGSYLGGDGDCQWGEISFDSGECRNWGNPFSEILADSYRYFSGTDAPLVAVDEEGIVPGVTVDNWPTSTVAEEEFACSRLSVLGFNSSVTSYDDNLLRDLNINDLIGGGETDTIAALTDAVGSAAGYGELPDGEYFVGNWGTASNDECSAKSITGGSLSQIRGLCPEAPRLDGTYLSAGLAHYFHTRAETPISTYGVTMAGARPNISVTVNDSQSIAIVPACRNRFGGSGQDGVYGRCALVAFQAAREPTATSGKYFIGWEDTEQGGDYDTDLIGVLEYSYSGGELTVTTTVIFESTADMMEFGYIISGTQTAADGAYYPTVAVNDDGGEVDGTTAGEDTTTDWCEGRESASPSCTTGTVSSTSGDINQQTVAFTVTTGAGSTAGKFLEEPLYYASKWGSFVDKSIDGSSNVVLAPDNESEWMIGNDEDGYEMRGYTAVSDPAQLTVKMQQIFKSLLDQPPVATATGVSLSSATGVGFLVNSLYYPELTSVDDADNKITWVGSLTGLLRGRDGYLREDANGNGYVDTSDKVVTFTKEGGVVNAQRNTLSAAGNLISDGGPVPMSSIGYLWDAEASLRALTQDTLPTQRAYTAPASEGRHILTGVKNAELDQVISTTPFAAAEEDLEDFGSNLRVPEGSQANLVNFTRGVEGISGMRKRTLNGIRHLLGDTVNATPKVVGAPSEVYDLTRSDASYANFRKRYENRRNVVYVGANDGMLHAFNAGFPMRGKEVGFYMGPTEADAEANGNLEAVAQHPLGSELWSYVPYNLLPHLQWLSSPDYRHVFYMDGDIETYDVKIFENDEANTYPGGWGTILVAGMRLGGGTFETEDEEYRSAYVIFDITDPESPPKLLAEVTDEDLGFTTSNVELAVNYDVRSARGEDESGESRTLDADELAGFGSSDFLSESDATLGGLAGAASGSDDPDSPALGSGLSDAQAIATAGRISSRKSDWYLVFGSGPTNHVNAKSTQASKLFYLDLKNLVAETPTSPLLQSMDIGVDNSFVGGVTVVDWEGNFKSDDIYFGLVEDNTIPVEEGDDIVTRGRLMHAKLTFDNDGLTLSEPTQVYVGPNSTDYPFSSEPLALVDRYGRKWVYAGTGRFYVSNDTSVENENIYLGVIVGKDEFGNELQAGSITRPIADVSDVVVTEVEGGYSFTGSVIEEIDEEVITNASVENLVTNVAGDSNGYVGWVRTLESESEVISDRSVFVSESLVVNSYDPLATAGESTGLYGCDSLGFGRSYSYVFDMYTGLPQQSLIRPDGAPAALTVRPVSYGGYVAAPTVAGGADVDYTSDDPDDPVNEESKSALKALANDGTGEPNGAGVELEDLPGQRRSWREVGLDQINVTDDIDDVVNETLE